MQRLEQKWSEQRNDYDYCGDGKCTLFDGIGMRSVARAHCARGSGDVPVIPFIAVCCARTLLPPSIPASSSIAGTSARSVLRISTSKTPSVFSM